MSEEWKITLSILECPDKSTVGQQKVFTNSPITVGRADTCDLIVSDPTVSRSHLIIKISDDKTKAAVFDMSTYGTEVSGKKVPKGSTAGFNLNNGDIIKLGSTLLRFEMNVKLSAQSTMLGKMDRSFLDSTHPPNVEKDENEDLEDKISEEVVAGDKSQKTISPLSIAIIIICLLALVYLIVFK